MKILVVLGVLVMLTTAVLDSKQQVPMRAEYLLVVDERVESEKIAVSETPQIEIRLKTKDGIQTVALEEYLCGVVLSEMLPSFHMEALKAQAVAARTFAARMTENGKHDEFDLCASSACCQAWKSEAQLRSSMGEAFADAMANAKKAVNDTQGEVVTHNNVLIEAVYYSCSGGSSEAAVAVWGSEVPYLQAVESPGEENASAYASTVRISLESFTQSMKMLNENVVPPVLPQDWFGEIRRSSGGGVSSIVIGGQVFSGTAIRQTFGLKSTFFTPEVEAGEVVFRVKGYGHRVGMSQYGADAMGRSGKPYEEIIAHYYKGVSIKKLSRAESGQLVWY